MQLKLFRRVYGLDLWIQARFTPLGRLLLAAQVAVGLFALNPRATLAYQLLLLLVAPVVAATFWAPAFRPRLRARRRLPHYATAGVPFSYVVEVENAGSRALRGLEASERVRLPRLRAEEVRAAAGLDGGGGWFARRVGYGGFVRGVRRYLGWSARGYRVPELAAGAQVSVPMMLLPLRRGYIYLKRLRFARPDPLGIFRATGEFAAADRILVLPRRYPVSWQHRAGHARVGKTGVSRSEAIGGSADFARLREYRPRDPLRHIHWRGWARLGEPVVKEFHDEHPARNALVLDTFAPPGTSGAAFEEAVSVAASFAMESGWRSGRLDLLFVGDTLVRIAESGEHVGAGRMLEALACVQRGSPAGFEQLSEGVRRLLGGFSACVCVLLEWDGAREAMVRAMSASGASVLVLVVGDDPMARIRAVGTAGLTGDRIVAVRPGQGGDVLAALGRGAASGPTRDEATHA